jgi:hypothetical protein
MAEGLVYGPDDGFRGWGAMTDTLRSSKTRACMAVEAVQARADAKVADLALIIKELQAAGKTTLRAIAGGLNDAGISASRGGEWSAAEVMRVLERLDSFHEEEAAA